MLNYSEMSIEDLDKLRESLLGQRDVLDDTIEGVIK